MHWSDEAFYPIDTVFYVESILPLHYVYFNFLSQRFINSDAAVPGLNREQAHSLPFLVPSSEVLNVFVAHVEPIFQLVQSLRRRSENLRTTRDLLLPKLVSGEVDISELDIATPEVS